MKVPSARRAAAAVLVVVTMLSCVFALSLAGAVEPRDIFSLSLVTRSYGLTDGGETVTLSGSGFQSSYRSNGLQLFFDGYDNAGRGEASHSTTETVWADLSGSDNSGMIENANPPATIEDMWQSGNALRLNNGRADQGVILPSAFNNMFNSDRTIEIVFNSNDLTDAILFGSGFGGTGTESVSLVRNATTGALTFSWKGDPLWTSASAVTTRATDTTVSLSLNKNAGMVKVYVNGQLIGTHSDDRFKATDFSNNDTFYIGRDGRTGSTVLNGDIYGVRIYNRVLSDGEVAHNFALDTRRYIEPTNPLPSLTHELPTVKFGNAEATGVQLISDEAIIAVTPVHAAGKVKVIVGRDSLTATLTADQGYKYLTSVKQSYGTEDCDTCHTGDVHATHRSFGCDLCHKGVYNKDKGAAFEITNYNAKETVGGPNNVLPPKTKSEACGVNQSGCHAVVSLSGPGKTWHGWKPKAVAAAHRVSASTGEYDGCSGGLSGYACHRQGSDQSPFFFGDMNLAQAHSDYAWAASKNYVRDGVPVAGDVRNSGCAVCHDGNDGNDHALKTSVAALFNALPPGDHLSCTSCHKLSNGSYVIGSEVYPTDDMKKELGEGVCFKASSSSVTASALSVGSLPASDDASATAADGLAGLLSRLSVEVRAVLGVDTGTGANAAEPLQAETADPSLDAGTLLQRYLPTTHPGVDL